MKTTKLLALSAAAAILAFSVNAYAAKAKEVKIASNNTPYSDTHVQQLAATALGMGVKEPVSLSRSGGNVVVSGSGSTKCTFKVGEGDAPKIQGVNCK